MEIKRTEKVHFSFEVLEPNNRESCAYCYVFYVQPNSNIIESQSDVEISNRSFTRLDHIQSVFINMSLCDVFIVPQWSVIFRDLQDTHSDSPGALEGINTTDSQQLPVLMLGVSHRARNMQRSPTWFLVHMKKPPNIAHYATWKVWLEVLHTVSRVSFEVLLSNSTSSAVYEWNHHTISDVYMTIDKAVNFLFVSDYVTSDAMTDFKLDFNLWFVRHFTYEDRIDEFVAGQTPERRNFTFHTLR